MSKYRYIANRKASWDRTTAFIATGVNGSPVRVEMGQVADLDPTEIADLQKHFILEQAEVALSPVTESFEAPSYPGKKVS